MILINIVHKSSEVLEYLLISSFFKFFGVSTYNSEVKDVFKDPYNKTDEDDSINPVYIFITNSSGGRQGQLDTRDVPIRKKVFVNKKDSSPIIFPQLYDDSILAFFDKLIDKIISVCDSFKSSEEEVKQLETYKKDIIEMYYNINPLKNFYLPLRILRSQENASPYIMTLKSCVDIYKRKVKSQGKKLESYAVLNLKYMINRLCESSGFEPLVAWNEVINDDIILRHNNTNSKRIDFISAGIFEDSGVNNQLAEAFYIRAAHRYDYYAYYRLARVYEFRLDNRSQAENFLVLAYKTNSNYYRAIYKLGIYAYEKSEYNIAFMFFTTVINILENKIETNVWQPLEMEYYIKSCGRIMNLNHYLRSEGIIKYYYSKVVNLLQGIGNNKFINNLCIFLKLKKNMVKKIEDELSNDAWVHANEFCGIDNTDKILGEIM